MYLLLQSEVERIQKCKNTNYDDVLSIMQVCFINCILNVIGNPPGFIPCKEENMIWGTVFCVNGEVRKKN